MSTPTPETPAGYKCDEHGCPHTDPKVGEVTLECGHNRTLPDGTLRLLSQGTIRHTWCETCEAHKVISETPAGGHHVCGDHRDHWVAPDGECAPGTPAGGLTTALTEDEREQIEDALDGGRMYDDVPTVAASIKANAMRAAVDQVRPVPREFVRVEDMQAAVAAAVVQARAEDRARIEAAMRELCDTSQNDALRISRAMVALGEGGQALLAALDRDRAALTATEDGDRP